MNQEAGVERNRARRRVDDHRIGVAAEPIGALEERDAVATASSMALMTTSGSMPFSFASASIVCCKGFDMCCPKTPLPGSPA